MNALRAKKQYFRKTIFYSFQYWCRLSNRILSPEEKLGPELDTAAAGERSDQHDRHRRWNLQILRHTMPAKLVSSFFTR